MRQIVVDVSGGGHAPDTAIKAAAQASLSLRDTQLVLVGDAAVIGSILPQCRHDGSRVRVHHAGDWVHMDESPSQAIAARADCSIVVAADLVARGEGDALVSGGSARASVLACARRWQRIDGVEQPALASVYPTELRRGAKNDPFALILDAGAALDATALDLVSFALMGATYSRIVSDNTRPRVALLSNSCESISGSRIVIDAHEILRSLSNIHFVGNIEAMDIPRGVADVIVCAGDVGNAVVQLLYGVAQTVESLFRYASNEKLVWRAAGRVITSGMERLKWLYDWKQYGGSPLLGFTHPLIQVNPQSSEMALANAIRLADKCLRGDLTSSIQDNIVESKAHLAAS